MFAREEQSTLDLCQYIFIRVARIQVLPNSTSSAIAVLKHPPSPHPQHTHTAKKIIWRRVTAVHHLFVHLYFYLFILVVFWVVAYCYWRAEIRSAYHSKWICSLENAGEASVLPILRSVRLLLELFVSGQRGLMVSSCAGISTKVCSIFKIFMGFSKPCYVICVLEIIVKVAVLSF